MKLIFIYGPPGAGKLTIAKELAKLTGLKLFHNQMVTDLLLEFFEVEQKGIGRVSDKIRLLVFELAAKQKLPGMIFTYCYALKDDDAFVRQTLRRVEKHGGEVSFVQVICSREVLRERILEDSRKAHKKIQSVEALEKVLERYDLFSPIPFVKSLRIESDKLSAKDAARKIRVYYKL